MPHFMPPSGVEAENALELLSSDHREVEELFERYQALADSSASDAQRRILAEEICTLLTVHAIVEEEIFYPAAREALDDDALLDEALAEHEVARELMDEIQAGEPDDPVRDSTIRILAEHVAHHVAREESELFPQLGELGLDLTDIGARMAQRQEELLSIDPQQEES